MARKSKSTSNHSTSAGAIGLNCESKTVRKRLDRIAANYDLLDEMLADLETRVPVPSPTEGNSAAGPVKPR